MAKPRRDDGPSLFADEIRETPALCPHARERKTETDYPELAARGWPTLRMTWTCEDCGRARPRVP